MLMLLRMNFHQVFQNICNKKYVINSSISQTQKNLVCPEFWIPSKSVAKLVKTLDFWPIYFMILHLVWNLQVLFFAAVCLQFLISLHFTVWKCQDFSVIHNLREINFARSRSSKIDFFCNFRGSEFC